MNERKQNLYNVQMMRVGFFLVYWETSYKIGIGIFLPSILILAFFGIQ